MMKKNWLLKCLALIASLTWLIIFSFPDNRLHLVFCDVGQGDATLITKGFNQILIDGGPNEKVLDCLSKNMPFFDKTIEIVALTHPEADHLTGIIPVMEKYKVNYFLTGPEGNNSAIFAELVKELEGFCKDFLCSPAKGRLENVYTGEKIKLGDVVLQSLWPTREWMAENLGLSSSVILSEAKNLPKEMSGSDSSGGKPLQNDMDAVLGAKATDAHLNDYSLVFLLTYNGKRVLLMGDADTRVQDKFIDSITSLPIDILKFPHHGSKTGMSKTFLEQIKPKEAVISVGKNSFGHPTEETLDMLKQFNVTIRRTDLEGEIKYTF